MKKILSFAFLASILFFSERPLLADYQTELSEQNTHFFAQLTKILKFDFEKECDAHRALPDNADFIWTEETHEAIKSGKLPAYLKDLHCIISNRSRRLLYKYQQRNTQSEANQIAYNLRSFVMLHSFHGMIHDKIKDLAKRGFKKRFGRKAKVPKFELDSSEYWKLSKSVTSKVERSFTNNFEPKRMARAGLKSMRIYQDETLMEEVMKEARERYPFNYNMPFMYDAITRIAERRVMIKFIRGMVPIFSKNYRIARRSTYFKNKENLTNKDSVFTDRYLKYILQKKTQETNRFDSNIDFFLLELSALNLTPLTTANIQSAK